MISVVWTGTEMSVYLDGVLDSSGSMTVTPYSNNVSYRVGSDTYRTWCHWLHG